MAEKVLLKSLFEEDYIIRSLGSIVNQPEIALTELVANAWDAGATRVDISIPLEIGGVLKINDNGIGMSENDFENRWMKLGYNRLLHQGKKVIFPNGLKQKRIAFGRNGVGRHGLFCFGDEYNVTTHKDGESSQFTVKPNVESEPFAVISRKKGKSNEHGTSLEVKVTKNLPDAKKISEIISARFLLDPSFIISVNGKTLDLIELSGGQEPKILNIKNGITLELYFIDTTKPGRKSIFQGIAFWQGGRLVGEPSWTLGNVNILDGRSTLAKRYTVVVKTNDLSDFIKEDWSGFIKHDIILAVYEEVEKVLNMCFEEVASTTLEIFKDNLSPSVKKAINDLNPLAKKEIEDTLQTIIYSNPKAKQESIEIAAQAIIKLEKTKSGKELLEKIANLSEEDIEGLNEILSNWTVEDAKVVLNEIERRLSVINAIRKLSSEKDTDELHVLHPLITEARWLFGPEYESSEFFFNRQLQKIVKEIFGNEATLQPSTNPKRRPDLICLPNSSISITGVEDLDSETQICEMRKILVIELKKGGFILTRKERNQASDYIEDLYKSNLGSKCDYVAFVVGDKIDSNVSLKSKVCDDHGIIYITTYNKLVDTAEKRMFNLRTILAHRYDDIPGMELYTQAILNI